MGKKCDWSAAKIKYELDKMGLTLYALSLDAGFADLRTCSYAIAKPHKKGELVISKALGVAPHIIWPSRYNDNGIRLKPQPSYNYKDRNKKSNINKKPTNRHGLEEVKYAS